MNALDKQGDLLLDNPPEKPPEIPRQATKLLFMPGGATADSGGRAAGTRTRPPGSRFNKPTAEDIKYYEETLEERTDFIKNDSVVKSASGGDPIALLVTLKSEVAREAASLGYQRLLLEQMGKDITAVSGRRIDALKKIADIEMEMRKIGFEQINVYGEKFQKIFKLWIEAIRSVAEETLSPEELDLFFNRLQTELDGWEAKAADLVR